MVMMCADEGEHETETHETSDTNSYRTTVNISVSNSCEQMTNVNEWNEWTTIVQLMSLNNEASNCETAVIDWRYGSSYFFCLSASWGTEGIKGVKNFVPFLASYRGFYVPQLSSSTIRIRISYVYLICTTIRGCDILIPSLILGACWRGF